VHEAAHVFHNCKGATGGLLATRTWTWLLDLAIANRETFARACEAHSRLLVPAHDRARRRTLFAELAAELPPLPEDFPDTPRRTEGLTQPGRALLFSSVGRTSNVQSISIECLAAASPSWPPTG
jgi:hypothetical protein